MNQPSCNNTSTYVMNSVTIFQSPHAMLDITAGKLRHLMCFDSACMKMRFILWPFSLTGNAFSPLAYYFLVSDAVILLVLGTVPAGVTICNKAFQAGISQDSS
mmetsp:Transcript_25796/g.56574  ORF Transcript_25796/g.56574 Transcript_25796/m.56574 type:complete len:103 (+) Transcript_25796:346-654(+)